MSRWGGWLLALALFAGAQAGGAQAAQLAVIVGPETETGALSPGRLRAIFSMQLRRWPDGTPIHVYTLPPYAALFERFSRHCLQVPGRLVSRIWLRNRYTGVGWLPERVASQAEMVARVGARKGAIGYVDLAQPLPELGRVRVLEGLCR